MATTIASDAFGRTLTGSWGSADIGGPWTIVGGATIFGVGSGFGTIAMQPTYARSALLNGVSTTRAHIRVKFQSDSGFSGAAQSFNILGRYVDASNIYAARARIESGLLRLYILNNETALASSTTITHTYVPGEAIWVDLLVTDTNPTTISAKMWLDGAGEPGTYQQSVTDSTAAMQFAATIGLGGTLSSAATAATYSYDSYFAEDPSGVNSPPTVTVTPTSQNVSTSTLVNLTASATDADGSITGHAWSFVYPTTGAPAFTNGTTATPSFTTGSTLGSLYVAKDTVTDNASATGTGTAEVRIPSATNVTALSNYTPIGDAWTVAGGAANESVALSDGSSTTYVESPDITSTPIERRWRIQPMTTRTGYRFTLLGMSITTTDTHNSKVRIYQGGTLITERATSTLKKVSDNTTANVSTTPTDLYFDLTAGEISAVNDPGNLWLGIQTGL